MAQHEDGSAIPEDSEKLTQLQQTDSESCDLCMYLK